MQERNEMRALCAQTLMCFQKSCRLEPSGVRFVLEQAQDSVWSLPSEIFGTLFLLIFSIILSDFNMQTPNSEH